MSPLCAKPTRNDLQTRSNRVAKGESPRPVTRTNHFHDALVFKLNRFSTNC